MESEKQTKEWRKEQSWYTTGKKNECEKFQTLQIEQIVDASLIKTGKRLRKGPIVKLEINPHPFHSQDAFLWTEDFDGWANLQGYDVYFNLKFVVGKGGAQTRSLKLVFDFVDTQLKYLVQHKNEFNIFVNILDGDESFQKRKYIEYLLELPEYEEVKDFVFIGDLYLFENWWKRMVAATVLKTISN